MFPYPNIPLSNLTDYDVLAIACKLYTNSSNDNPFINYIGVKEQILNLNDLTRLTEI